MWSLKKLSGLNQCVRYAQLSMGARIRAGRLRALKPELFKSSNSQPIVKGPVATNKIPNNSSPQDLQIAPQKEIQPNQFDRLLELKDYDALSQLYRSDRLFASESADRLQVYAAILNNCVTMEDVAIVSDIIEDIDKYNIPLRELSYKALIRCFIAGDAIRNGTEVMNIMIDNGLIPDSTLLIELFECALRLNNTHATIEILDTMCKMKTSLKTEQFPILMKVFAHSDQHFIEQCVLPIHNILKQGSTKYFGVPETDLLNIVAQMRQISVEEVKNEGILIKSLADVPEDLENFKFKSAHVIRGKAPYYANNDGTISKYSKDPILVHSMANPLGSQLLQNDQESRLREYFLIPTKSTELEPMNQANRRARMVNISTDNYCCPNCNNEIQLHSISEIVRAHFRLQISSEVWNQSAEQRNYLTEFSEWLQARNEFDVVIDGNEIGFDDKSIDVNRSLNDKMSTLIESVEKIEKVINVIKRISLKHRILVVLPYIELLDAEVIDRSLQRLLKRLLYRAELYMVPKGANDDYYWLYATVVDTKSNKQAVVVTNNDMKQYAHIVEPRSMMRWRTTQQIQHTPFLGGYSLSFPVKYTRDFQQSSNGCWHIPSMNSSEWLCLQL